MLSLERQENAERNGAEASRLAGELEAARAELREAGKAAVERVGEERAAAEAAARVLEDRWELLSRGRRWAGLAFGFLSWVFLCVHEKRQQPESHAAIPFGGCCVTPAWSHRRWSRERGKGRRRELDQNRRGSPPDRLVGTKRTQGRAWP